MVVVISPLINFAASLIETSEPVPVEAFVSKFAIQTFNESILSWLSWLDKTKLYSWLLTPKEHCLIGKFTAVVTNNLIMPASRFAQLMEKPSNLSAADEYWN